MCGYVSSYCHCSESFFPPPLSFQQCVKETEKEREKGRSSTELQVCLKCFWKAVEATDGLNDNTDSTSSSKVCES
jgi:hypothetical protein